jgi:gamma-tubulin complex component 3
VVINQPSHKHADYVQSLCHFFHNELSEYHRLLAILESQMALTAPITVAENMIGPETKPAEGAGLTLMRLGLWTEEMRLKMRLMSNVVDDAKGERGGEA